GSRRRGQWRAGRRCSRPGGHSAGPLGDAGAARSRGRGAGDRGGEGARREPAAGRTGTQDARGGKGRGARPDSPLKDFLVYLQTTAGHDRALAGIRRARNRQADTIEFLQLGHIRDLPELWRFNLEATPALCEAYGSALNSAAAAVSKTRSDYLVLAI